MMRFRVNPYNVMASIHAVKSTVRRFWKPALFVFIMLFNPEKHLLPFLPKARLKQHTGAWLHPIPNLPGSEHAVYEGQTLGGKFMHGDGKLILTNGTIYEGNFQFGHLEKGKITYPDYSVFEGSIVSWKERVGKVTYPDGSVESRIFK